MRFRFGAALAAAMLLCAPALAQPYQHQGGMAQVPATCTPYDHTFSTTASTAVTILPANAARESVTFQVPSTLSGGLYIEWGYNYSTGAQIIASTASANFPAGTLLVTLDVSVLGTGPITAYATTGGVSVPLKECQ